MLIQSSHTDLERESCVYARRNYNQGLGPRASWSKVPTEGQLSIHEHLYNPFSSWFGVQKSPGPKSAPEKLLSVHEHLYSSPLNVNVSYRWLSNQRSYMTNGDFEIWVNIGIYDNMNGHRSFDIYHMINDFGSMLEYDVLNMFLRFKEKYAL